MTTSSFAFITDMNPTTVIVILVIAVLLFGGSKLPELARGLGKARREFKRASDEIEDEVQKAMDDDGRKKKNEARKVAIDEEEERAKIRAKLEQEERAKLAANKDSTANETPNANA